MHGLRALSEAIQSDKKLTTENVSVGIVGPNEKFRMIEGEEVKQWLDVIEAEGGNAPAAGATVDAPAAGGMDVDQ